MPASLSPALSTARPLSLRGGAAAAKMVDITPNVSFDTIAREWRCKWSADSDKASLVAAQNELSAIIKEVKGVKGVKSVQRVVCGGCLDFKVVTALDVASFGEWEKAKFAPEVCAYVCIYVCMYVCMYAYRASPRSDTDICMYVYIFLRTSSWRRSKTSKECRRSRRRHTRSCLCKRPAFVNASDVHAYAPM
jgi:hypothetical protein